MMYEKLVSRIRFACEIIEGPTADLLTEAADAIERLSRECKVLYAMLGTHPDPRGELGVSGVLREPPKEEA